MKFQLIRHATSILYYGGKKILIDPVLNEQGSTPPIPNTPNQKNNPMVDLPLPIETIIDCDVLLITHTHGDHFNEESAKYFPKEIPVYCQPEDEDLIKNWGFSKVTAIHNKIELNQMMITRTAGEHGHGEVAKQLAPVSGYVLTSKDAPTVYITGDTVWYSEVENILDQYKPDIVIAFSGAASFNNGEWITLNDQDILNICQKVPESKVIAIHTETWNHCILTRSILKEFTKKHNIEKQVLIPADGEELNI